MLADLSYEGDDGTTELYPVPVRVQNLLDAGREVNTNEEDLDDVLTRRFFLWDGVSGKRTLATPAEVLRVADYIQISTMVQSDTTGYIHPPILTIHYTGSPPVGWGGVAGRARACLCARVSHSLSVDVVIFCQSLFYRDARLWCGWLLPSASRPEGPLGCPRYASPF